MSERSAQTCLEGVHPEIVRLEEGVLFGGGLFRGGWSCLQASKRATKKRELVTFGGRVRELKGRSPQQTRRIAGSLATEGVRLTSEEAWRRSAGRAPLKSIIVGSAPEAIRAATIFAPLGVGPASHARCKAVFPSDGEAWLTAGLIDNNLSTHLEAPKTAAIISTLRILLSQQ
jgi:hypothetical protein